MADGRSLVAALALGAEGMNMGTRFIATQGGAGARERQAGHRGGQRARHPPGHAPAAQHRARADQRRRRAPAAKGARTGRGHHLRGHAPEVAGVYPRIMQDGDMEAGVWSCGMVAGLIHDVPTVQQLIDRIMA
jgi:NAD(P)H-dependent flavin oxidoreductase YrpB (nitropropane dioxygenase family)